MFRFALSASFALAAVISACSFASAAEKKGGIGTMPVDPSKTTLPFLAPDLKIDKLIVVQPVANYAKVYVKNQGFGPAKNFVVRITIKGPHHHRSLQQTIALCKAGDVQVAHFHWTESFDKHSFMITVDATGVVKESNETNNNYYVRWFPWQVVTVKK